MHGGHVEAHSAGVGQGSEFVVRLPIVAADRRKQPRAETRQLEDAELAPARRILIVDDNADNANSLAMMMRFLGHETALAYDGVEALETAETFHPDVILLDIGLPKLSGHDVARSIRARPWGKSVMLVALTGWGQDHDRRRSQEAGFDHHMVKPVEFEALRQIMVSAS
jgi:CheY-like chemotaxis protein